MIDESIMKTATVADLRNHFARISMWIENGESVEIVKRGKPFAQLSPPPKTKSARFDPVEHTKWLEETWKGRTFSAEEVQAMQDAEDEIDRG